jgi:hypothetical protein
MIKLLIDLAPFEKGEILSVGKTYDEYLVNKGMAVWVKVDKEKIKTK